MKDFIKILLAVFAVAALRIIFGLNNYQAGIDDSNIYFVYVRNFYEGNGFVYNIGGPRVEGFTSFLWTILLTIIYSLKFLPFETCIMVFCFFITTGTTYLYFRYFKSMASESHAWILVSFILLIPGFVDWNIFSLMDLCLWIFASSWATLLLLSGKNNRLFCIITILLPLIRPEGIAVALILWFGKLLKDYALHSSIRKAIKNNAGLLAGILICICLLTTFRLFYFGYPLPNTFYAKISSSLSANIKQAFFYFYDTIRHTSVLPFLLLAISLLYILFQNWIYYWKTHINVLILTFVILFFVGYPFLTGGDHFRYSRFFQPVFPLIGLLFLLVFYKRINLSKPLLVIAVILVILTGNLNSTDQTSFRDSWKKAASFYFKQLGPDLLSASQLQSEFNIALYGKRLANHINQELSALDSTNNLPSFGVIAAGGIGYVYKGQTIDLMGLNNPDMAHANRIKSQGIKNHGSFDKMVFYKQDPDIFLSWPDPLTPVMEQTDELAIEFLDKLRDSSYFINRVCNHIFNDEQFNRIYTYSKISNNYRHFYSFVQFDEFTRKFPRLRVEKLKEYH